ncbi:hypothetical protein [Paenibacillus faecis]|nr:hypothetical protein [Paenibacillus faecis]
MNNRLAAILRVIEKRRSRGATDRDIMNYKESLARGVKNEQVKQQILNLR